jgi:hypothetical protein
MWRLDQKGVIHHILPLIIIVGIAVLGVYFFVSSHALPYPHPDLSGCAEEMPSVTTNPEFPLEKTTSFLSTKPPGDIQFYTNGHINPTGYISRNHLAFTKNGLIISGYPDPSNKYIDPSGKHPTPGVVGAGFDLNSNTVYGGFDVCLSMTAGNWQAVRVILIAWPVDNQFNEGEIDMFEASPQSLLIHIHEIVPPGYVCSTPDQSWNCLNPRTSAYNGTWPSTAGPTSPHLISARWDPTDGYNFYLDGTLIHNVPIAGNVALVNTRHHLSIQMQDQRQNSKNSENATIYWAATYQYNANAVSP